LAKVVLNYHRKARIRLPNAKVHAIAHAMVETQIASETKRLRVGRHNG